MEDLVLRATRVPASVVAKSPRRGESGNPDNPGRSGPDTVAVGRSNPCPAECHRHHKHRRQLALD